MFKRSWKSIDTQTAPRVTETLWETTAAGQFHLNGAAEKEALSPGASLCHLSIPSKNLRFLTSILPFPLFFGFQHQLEGLTTLPLSLQLFAGFDLEESLEKERLTSN